MTDGLNLPQREAVRYLDGPLLVLAGAGSGKTRVITQKIAYLVRECGYAAQHVAAITFTNKAAKEMRDRATELMPGKSLAGLSLCTFHALGVRILRAEATLAGLKPRFSILDASDSARLLVEASQETDKARLRALAACISAWKSEGLDPSAARAAATDEMAAGAAETYTHYQRSLSAYQAVDFDDLIRLPLALLEGHPEALERWQGKLRYLLVDEYQDTNRSQYRLMRLLAGARGALTAVGDDDQAIYAWRGADIENLRQLGRDFPQLKVIKLEQNYRSTTRILKAANTLISVNPKLHDKRLWSELGNGDPVQVVACRDAVHEAETVVMKLFAQRFERRGQWRDYAILYRGNHQARAFEQQLRQHKVPYLLSGGQSFFERSEIKDLSAWLRLIANTDDDPAFIRAVTTPRRGIGGQTMEALGRYAGSRHRSLFDAAQEVGAAAHLPPKSLAALGEFTAFIQRIGGRAEREPAGEVLEDLLKAVGFERHLFESFDVREAEGKWANVRDFVGWLTAKGAEDKRSLTELSQSIAIASMLDKNGEDADAVQLATLHAAKGLEFRHVFLVGVEEGLLPHRESTDPVRLEEERRLMYVGITRARTSLHLSYCERRSVGKELRPCEPSRFIAEMGDDLAQLGRGQSNPANKAANLERLRAMQKMLAGKMPAG